MKETNKNLSKKPSDNNTTRNSSFIKNDNNNNNIKSARKSSKNNSTSEARLNLNHSHTNNNSFYEALNIILENNNNSTINNIQEDYNNNTQIMSKSKEVKEFSFDSLNTSEFDNSEITIEHISTPVEKNIIKKGNILMKIENNSNIKNKSVLPNIVELAEEDLISINSKDTNKTAIVSNNYNNYDTKNAFYKAKNVINESNEQFKIYSFIKNNYETSIKKNKDKYVKLTPIKKNRIKKNINNNKNIYNNLEINTHKKTKLRESNIKQINKKLIFEEKKKNNLDITISSSPNSEYEKEQIIFDKIINYTDINDDDNQNNSYTNKNINDISSESDNNSLKTLIKKEDRKNFTYNHNDNYDTDISNYTLNKGYLNIDKTKKDIFLNNTMEKKNRNKNTKFEKSFFNYNTFNYNIETINKIKIRKNQYRKYKYRAKNNKTFIDNINDNDNINDSINIKRNNKNNIDKKDYLTNYKKYFNYNLYENLLNTDKLTSIRFTRDELSQLELRIESFKEKRIIIFSILCSLCEKFKYKRETFHLTISLIDGYLYNLVNNKSNNKNISERLTDLNNNSLIIISLSCLLICSKIEETKYIKPISYIRALYENEYMLKYFQNNINNIKIEKIFFFEQKIMILLKWKIFYVNINTWLNWYICQWDLYVDSADFVKMELIKNYGETNIFYFKKNNEQSYYNYRIINQLIKIIKFDLNSILYDNKLLVMCTIFICIEHFYNKINNNNTTYILLFNNFIKCNLNENIINDENYINTLKYCKELIYGFLENNLYNFDLPIFYQTDNLNDNNNQSYEDFLSFQTFNQNIPVYLNQRIQRDSFIRMFNQ